MPSSNADQIYDQQELKRLFKNVRNTMLHKYKVIDVKIFIQTKNLY